MSRKPSDVRPGPNIVWIFGMKLIFIEVLLGICDFYTLILCSVVKDALGLGRLNSQRHSFILMVHKMHITKKV